MERKELKMYSDYKSPFAYLAFDPAFALQERFALSVRWIPCQLRIKDRGQRSVYSDYKAKYSYLDARRWAKPRGILIRAPQRIYDTAPAVLATLGLSGAEYREYLVGEGARAYAAAQEEAAADNVFGVPLFFFEREPFWGHDRMAVLEQRLIEAGLSLPR